MPIAPLECVVVVNNFLQALAKPDILQEDAPFSTSLVGNNETTEACRVVTNPVHSNSSLSSTSLVRLLHSSMSQVRLNSAAISHVHKDTLDAILI
jgi:hypothetical protein